MTEIRHVVPCHDGGWAVVPDAEGAPATTGNGNQAEVFERRRDAEAYARDVVRRKGGGEVVLHTPSGEIVETSAVFAEEPIGAA